MMAANKVGMNKPICSVDVALKTWATDRQCEYIDAVNAHGSLNAASKVLGVRRENLTKSFQALKARAAGRGYKAGSVPFHPSESLDIPTAPDTNEPIADLITRKKAQHSRDQASEAFHALIKIKVQHDGPVAICAVGDPHVDDDRCDIGTLEHDMTIIGRTPGMYALHVGDITNNWVGRLGRLYAHQSTTANDGIRLAEWMFSLAPPLAVIGGNHDIWNEGMNWLQFCVRQAAPNAYVKNHGIRLELDFSDVKVRIHTRHDFPGHSQFNPVHGLRKEHLFGKRDHINIAGHKHTDTYAMIPSPDGYIQHMLRVSGYKDYDDFAKGGNFALMKMAPTCALVINPAARNHAELIKPFWDIAEAADYLAFKRRTI